MQSAAYYDKLYREDRKHRESYDRSKYYSLWATILCDINLNHLCPQVIDVGCGAGQFLKMNQDIGKLGFGFDFSGEAINKCKEKHVDAFVGNALNASSYEYHEFDVIVCTEVLEHIKKDIQVIKLWKQYTNNTPVYISVPKFGGEAHVRKFKTKGSVVDRYGELIDILHIHEIGKRWLLIGHV